MRQKNVCFCWGILGSGWSISRLNFQVEVGEYAGDSPCNFLSTLFFIFQYSKPDDSISA